MWHVELSLVSCRLWGYPQRALEASRHSNTHLYLRRPGVPGGCHSLPRTLDTHPAAGVAIPSCLERALNWELGRKGVQGVPRSLLLLRATVRTSSTENIPPFLNSHLLVPVFRLSYRKTCVTEMALFAEMFVAVLFINQNRAGIKPRFLRGGDWQRKYRFLC